MVLAAPSRGWFWKVRFVSLQELSEWVPPGHSDIPSVHTLGYWKCLPHPQWGCSLTQRKWAVGVKRSPNPSALVLKHRLTTAHFESRDRLRSRLCACESAAECSQRERELGEDVVLSSETVNHEKNKEKKRFFSFSSVSKHKMPGEQGATIKEADSYRQGRGSRLKMSGDENINIGAGREQRKIAYLILCQPKC